MALLRKVGGKVTSRQTLSLNKDVVRGNYNTITGSDNLICGNHNTVVGDNNSFQGNFNSITGNFNDITGSHNKVSGDQNKCTGNFNKCVGVSNVCQGAHNTLHNQFCVNRDDSAISCIVDNASGTVNIGSATGEGATYSVSANGVVSYTLPLPPEKATLDPISIQDVVRLRMKACKRAQKAARRGPYARQTIFSPPSPPRTSPPLSPPSSPQVTTRAATSATATTTTTTASILACAARVYGSTLPEPDLRPGSPSNDQEESSDDSACKVCFEKRKRVLLEQCKHVCLCSGCAKKLISNGLIRCPLCNTVNTKCSVVFL